MGKSVQIVNPGTTYEASITLYDYAFQDPPFTLERVIVHELAHVIFNKLTKKDILSFRSSLGWKQRQQTDYR